MAARASEESEEEEQSVSSSGESAVRRRRYSREEAALVANVYEFFKKESQLPHSLHRQQPQMRLSVATGIPLRSIQRLLSPAAADFPSTWDPERRDRTSVVPDSLKPQIRTAMCDLYLQKRAPTCALIIDRLGPRNWKWSESTMLRTLRRFGFTYGKAKNHYERAKEKTSIVLQRVNYIEQVRAYRAEGRGIFYMDETWFNCNMTTEKCWLDPEGEGGLVHASGVGSRLIVVHCCNADVGLVDGAAWIFKSKKSSKKDYHESMNSESFLFWLKEHCFPNLPARAVLVVDRATYHTELTLSTKAMPASLRKDAMLDWIISRNQHLRREDLQRKTKVQLRDMEKTLRPPPKLRAQELADEKFARKGIRILVLPVAHPELNPIEKVWGNVKQYICSRNGGGSLARVEELGWEGFDTVKPEHVAGMQRAVVKQEDLYMELADLDDADSPDEDDEDELEESGVD